MKKDESYMVCDLCLMVIANGDYSPIDYYFSGEAADKKQEEIDSGIEELSAGGYLVCGDEDYGFCNSACECCGESAGDRFKVVKLVK